MARASLVPDIIDAIVAGLRATPGFRAPTSSTDGITVFDGPEFLGSNDTEPDGFVVIGYGGEDLEARDDNSADDAVTATIDWATMSAANPKDIVENVECVAWYGTGGVDVSGTRRAVVAIAGLVETWLRDNDRLDLTQNPDRSYVQYGRMTAGRLRQDIVDGNSRAVFQFTLQLNSRT